MSGIQHSTGKRHMETTTQKSTVTEQEGRP